MNCQPLHINFGVKVFYFDQRKKYVGDYVGFLFAPARAKNRENLLEWSNLEIIVNICEQHSNFKRLFKCH